MAVRRNPPRAIAPAPQIRLCHLLKEKGLGVRVESVVTEHVSIVDGFFAEI